MRQNVIVALLSVIATLLAVIVFKAPEPASGQQAGGTAVVGGELGVATGQIQGGGGGAAFWIYDRAAKKIAVYYLGTQALELRAVRDVQYDFELTEVNRQAGQVTKVSEAKKSAKSARKTDKDE